MTLAQRTAIASPATGLLIFETNGSAPGFYYYKGTAWTAVSITGANTSLSNLTTTSINTSLIPGISDSIDLGSAAKLWRHAYFSRDVLINGLTIGLGGGVVSTNTVI